MSKALLIGNGENNPALLRRLAAGHRFILAADGGAEAALKAGLTVQAVIGDLDSLSPTVRDQLTGTELVAVSRQDNTDFEKAMDWLQGRHFQEVTAVGFTGGRLDFTLGNFLSVYPYLPTMQVAFAGNGWTVFPLLRGKTLTVRPGKRLSLLPLLPCEGLSLSGVKYPLKNASWKPGQNTGLFLSNETTAAQVNFSLSAGFVLLYAEE